MISFDYLHACRPMWLARLLQLRIPDRVYPPLASILAVLCILAGAGAIERFRLAQANSLETRYRHAFTISEASAGKAERYAQRVRALAVLDRDVHAIIESGDENAQELADIGNVLPQRAWLTQIAHDEKGLALQGRAESLTVLADVIRNLTRARGLRNPTLTDAQALTDRGSQRAIRYAVHVERAGS